jgi:hypothetical protein
MQSGGNRRSMTLLAACSATLSIPLLIWLSVAQ